MRRDTIRDQLERIARLAGYVDKRTGRLRKPGASRGNPAQRFRTVTLFALFVSNEGTFLVRPHVFNSRDGRTEKEWFAWFRKHYTTERPADGEPGLLRNILDGLSRRSGGEKLWRVARIIGWAPDDRSAIIRSEKSKTRHKTKHKRS